MASTKKRQTERTIVDARTGWKRRVPAEVYRARYRDEAGKEHARHFDRKVDAQRWPDEVPASVLNGPSVVPNAGMVASDRFSRVWAERQIWSAMTPVQNDLVRRKVTFGTFSGQPFTHLASNRGSVL